MKKSQLLGAACAGIITLLVSVTANAAIVYDVNRTIGAGTVTGFIETDGTIGLLSYTNITDWEITLTAPNLRGGSPGMINFSNDPEGISYISGSSLTASLTALSFDFDVAGENTLLLYNASNLLGYCVTTGTGCFTVTQGEAIYRAETPANTSAQTVERVGVVDIAVAPVPVPAAVWMFGSGLLGLIGVARRKVRV